MTVALIFLPLAVALAIAVLPLDRRIAAVAGLLGTLAEVVLAAVALFRFDAGAGMQFVTDDRWIPDFGLAPVRFHVGMDGLGLFMVALTAVGVAAALASSLLAGRERPRAHIALLLLLESAMV
ncbi:MAG TPA: hypothetical protein VFQ71_08940, partial [Gaiellales bacterium]|nr:hypothetical protein [Gaiellales bacterium]